MGSFTKRGFSLLEVIVASFIFLTVVGSLQGYWITVGKMMAKSRARMAASFVAEQLLEDISAKGYDKIDELASSGNLGMDITLYGREQHYSIKYKLKIVNVNEDLKSVLVEVSETGGGSLSFETLVCKGL